MPSLVLRLLKGSRLTKEEHDSNLSHLETLATHANRATLDLITAAYSTEEKTKLANLTDNFKGLFANASARNSAVPTPASGFYVLQSDTNTVWYYNGSSWINTGSASLGDMLKSIYDPTSKNADAFSMDSMTETSTKKVLTAAERASITAGVIVGDAKFGYMTADHLGWYILDGRAVSALSATAQAAAATLGWTTNIPTTRGMYPLAASPAIASGTFGGSNTIARSALPNVTLTGATGNESTTHTHITNSYTLSGVANAAYATSTTYPNVIAFAASKVVVSDNGAALGGTTANSYLALDGADQVVADMDTSHEHSTTAIVPDKTSNNNVTLHTHNYTTPSLNGGVTQTVHMPAYAARTEFVYLGM